MVGQFKQKSFLANIEHVLALFYLKPLTNLPLTTFQLTYQPPTTDQPMIEQLQRQPTKQQEKIIRNLRTCNSLTHEKGITDKQFEVNHKCNSKGVSKVF